MAKKKKGKKKSRLDLLVGAANELNEKLGLEPPIETKDVSEEDLEEKIIEASELLTDEDEFSKETEKVLDGLTEFDEDFEDEEPEAEEEPEEESEEEPEIDEDEEEDEDTEEEAEEAEEADEASLEDLEELKEEVEGIKKRGELVKLAKAEPIFEELLDGINKLRSGKAVKAAMMEILENSILYIETGQEEEEEAEEEKPKKSKKKSKKKSSKKSEKKSEKKAKKKSKKSSKKPAGKSNKAVIYTAWEDGEEDVDTLHEMVDKAVKRSTVRSWVNGWKNGRGLPAIAKD